MSSKSTVPTVNSGSFVVSVIEGETTRGAVKGSDDKPIPRRYAGVTVTLPGNRSDVAVTSARLKILAAMGVTGDSLARLDKACKDADARNAAFEAAYQARLVELGIVKAPSTGARKAAVATY